MNYKYIIAIDGWASGWFRGPMILKSNSVPIIVDSDHTPLYLKAWIPWKHYVPVKKDLSDLISNIKYL